MEADDSEKVEKFQLKCKSVLLTYHEAISLEIFQALPVWDRVQYFSYCVEKEGEDQGSHLYLDFWKQVDHGLDNWLIPGRKRCNASPNRVKGSGHRAARERGHFYVQCKHKLGKVDVQTNFPAGKAFVVKTHWVYILFQQGKLTPGKEIECAHFYKCLTPSFKQNIELYSRMSQSAERDEHFAKRRKVLKKLSNWKNIPAGIATWKKQYDEIQNRYTFLWLWSNESMQWVGKTEYVKSIFPDAWIHDGAVSWSGYNPNHHSAVVFDDVSDVCDYIKKNKPLFQANREKCVVNSSATNMYALEVDTCDKPIIVLANFGPKAGWTLCNSTVIELTEHLY